MRKRFCVCGGCLGWLVLIAVLVAPRTIAPAAEPERAKVPDAEAKTEKEMKPYTGPIVGTEVTFDMLPIPGGRFMMGSPDSEPGHKADEGPRHEVEIAPFWMGKCEVTWNEFDQWAVRPGYRMVGDRPEKEPSRDPRADAVTRPSSTYFDLSFGMGRDGYPAIAMSQLAARTYCKWLSAKTGRFYRLPTEAEWEYACRAGTTTAYSFGDDPAKLADYAWYASDDGYRKVGTKKPNPWGLFDMHGNVAEWTFDQYVPDGYHTKPGKLASNPLVIPRAVYPRAIRGGAWSDEADRLRSAARLGSSPDWNTDPNLPPSIWYLDQANFLGFRVVRPLVEPPAAERAALWEPKK